MEKNDFTTQVHATMALYAAGYKPYTITQDKESYVVWAVSEEDIRRNIGGEIVAIPLKPSYYALPKHIKLIPTEDGEVMCMDGLQFKRFE